MARIIAVGQPENDGERQVIAHLRDHAPQDWTVLHNLELARDRRRFEIDLVVVAPHAVTVVDIKGTCGHITVARNRWYPRGRGSFASPLPKLRQHAKVVKSLLVERDPRLQPLWVGQLLVLTDPAATLHDPDRADTDDVCHLDELVPRLADAHGSERRARLGADPAVLSVLTGGARPPSSARTFGNFEVLERLAENDDGVTEYRARNRSLGTGPQVRLRVHPLDPYLPEPERTAQRHELGNAYSTLWRLPGHPHVEAYHDYFVTDDESSGVLVVDDTLGTPLALRLTGEPLSRDEAIRVLRDVTSGLAHAHRHRVVHRAVGPETVLLAADGRALLTGFEHARGAGPRAVTVVNRLPAVLDPSYVAPEGHTDVGALSAASDLYALGVLGFRLLTGEMPFADRADQHRRRSRLPADELDSAGVSDDLATWLTRLCAHDPADRPDAWEALNSLHRALRRPEPRSASATGTDTAERDRLRDLPVGHQLTPGLVVREKLGSGSFSVVYRVHNVFARTDQVCKLVLTGPTDPVERLSQEYAPLERLPPHPNVVQVRHGDALPGFAEKQVPYLLFEYVPGTDVHRLASDGALRPAEVRRLGVDAATGLAHIHAHGVYHCDVKPGNLLWTDAGAKLIDFNVAVSIEHVLADAGSRRYLPPDYRQHDPDLADRDVYALGLTLYEALTCNNWPWDDRRAAPPDVPPRDPTTFTALAALAPAFVEVLLTAIAPRRADRYADAAAFATALERVRDVRARPPAPTVDRDHVGARHGERDNPFVAHLQTLYSQSPTSNSGTRGLDPRQFAVYVETLLDERLIPDVLDGRHRVVVITGNAGDGKTALLERLVVSTAREWGAQSGPDRANGADFTYRGRTFHTNLDGSQDEGDRDNDDVLLAFFAPYVGAEPSAWPADQTRLIAINEGRLVDFLRTHAHRFPALKLAVEGGLGGAGGGRDGVTLVNLNARSLVAGGEDSIFDKMVRELTAERFWEACSGCTLAAKCYAPHNARTLSDPDVGGRVTERLRTLYTIAHLRGKLHMTLRDLRSALAYLLTSGRGCADIRDLYAAGDAAAILSGFYFQSWTGPPEGRDRLLALLRDCDLSDRADPALDRTLDFVGPSASSALIEVHGRGDYDRRLLDHLFELPRGGKGSTETIRAHREYTAAARRRYFFESTDPGRWRRLLSHRSAVEFLRDLDPATTSFDTTRSIVYAINRSEGLPDPEMLGQEMALTVRPVRGGTIRSYRLLPLDRFSTRPDGPRASEYVETEADHLRLSYADPELAGSEPTAIAIRLDLYELLWRLRRGGVPGTAERQGHHLGLTIFKHQLSSAPYQSVLLTVTGRDRHQVSRGCDGMLTLTPVTQPGDN